MSQTAPRPYHLRWSNQNPKVRKLGGVTFGIPALKAEDGFATCPQAGRCSTICYARQSKYEMPVVKGAREFNLRFIRERGLRRFVEAACDDLARKRSLRFVRVHDSGDFFSQEYLDSWYEIASRNETKAFVAYTTSFHLELWKGLPGNFRLVQSEGGQLDDRIDRARPFSRIFENQRVREEAGFADGSCSDKTILDGELRIGLVYHGRYAPSPEHRRLFGWKADVEVVGQRKGLVSEEKPEPPAAAARQVDVDVDVRGLLSEADAVRVAEFVRLLKEKRENLSGKLSEMEKLSLQGRKLDRIAGCLEELLPR